MTMFFFGMQNTDGLLYATIALTGVSPVVILKCSPSIVSLTVSSYSPRCFIVQLQIMPPFFTLYFCDRPHRSMMSLNFLYNTTVDMKRSTFSSLLLSLLDFSPRFVAAKADLYFSSPRYEYNLVRELILIATSEEDVDQQIDYTTFVSFDSIEFKRILELNVSSVGITLTDSQVKFYQPNREIILTIEENKCIIRGLAAGEEIQFLITLSFDRFFLELANKSKRIWLFKSTTSWNIMTAPIGLHVGYFMYFQP